MIDLWPWIAELPAAILAMAALVLPGTIISWALGLELRRYPLAVPLLSMSLIGVLPIPAVSLRIPWGWGALFAGTLTLGAFLLLLRLTIGDLQLKRHFSVPSEYSPSRQTLVRVGAIGVPMLMASLLLAYGMMASIEHPATPPQTWDAVFHINAVEWIQQTGNGSTLHLAAVSSSEQRPGFYPAGWHDLVTFAYFGDATSATTMTILVVAAVLWPIGATVLASTIIGKSPWVIAFTPLVAATFTSFPERLASYGTLWPTALAYALVPYMVAVLIALFDNETPDRWKLLVVATLGVPGMAIAHPTSIFAALLIGIWVLPAHVWRIYSGKLNVTRAWKYFITAASAIFVFALVLVTQTSAWQTVTSYRSRGPVGSGRWTLWEVLVDAQYSFQGYGNADPSYYLPIVTVLGLFVIATTQHRRFLLLSWGILFFLYVESVVAWKVFQPFISPWYSDPVRIGGMLPLLTAALGGIGWAFLIERLAARLQKYRPSWNGRIVTMTIVAMLIVAFNMSSSRFGLSHGAWQIKKNYWQDNKDGINALILNDEMDMMRRAAGQLEPDATVLGDPMNGSPMFYSVAHVNTYFKHVWPDTPGEVSRALIGLSNPRPPAGTCEFLQKNNIRYYYHDTLLYWPEVANELMISRELRDIDPQALGFEKIDEGGGASLWRITTCDTN